MAIDFPSDLPPAADPLSPGLCPYCQAALAPSADRCPQCGRTPLPPRRCAICAGSGHPREVSSYVTNGFERGADPRYRIWPVHHACREKLQMERLSELSHLRCSACGARAEFSSLYSGRGLAPMRCYKCGSRPEAVEAEWGARANPCAICQLPIFELIHEIWPGADEDTWRSEDANFRHGVHAACALRLGFRR